MTEVTQLVNGRLASHSVDLVPELNLGTFMLNYPLLDGKELLDRIAKFN